MTRPAQFALPFPSGQTYAPDEFFPAASNEAALAWLQAPLDWPALRLAVHGEPGTGKTHLLHHFRARHDAAILPAGELRRFMAPPPAPALAIDDADSVPDGEALLHFLNSAAEHRKPLLLAAREPPSRWPFTLPDLVSRLRATPTVALLPPDDSLLEAMLARLLAERQLAVPERLQAYLLARLPRTGNAMREAAARLDRLLLAAGGAMTAKHAQQVVDECIELDPATEKGPEHNSGPPLTTES